jgi:hypothetical protein
MCALIWSALLSSGQGEAPVAGGRAPRGLPRPLGCWRACRCRRAVRLIFAGWVPAGRWFGWSDVACLMTSVDQRGSAHSALTGSLHALPPTGGAEEADRGIRGSRVVEDGEGPAPASQFAGDGAMFAMTDRLPRVVKLIQRLCRRRLPVGM